MATLTLHTPPDTLHAMLTRLARMHQRSVNDEAVAVFAQALPKELSRAEVIASVIAETDKLRQGMTSFLTAEQIDAAIEEGRM